MIQMTITIEAPDKESLLQEVNTLMGAKAEAPADTPGVQAPLKAAVAEEQPAPADTEPPKAAAAVPTAKKAAEPAVTREQLAVALVALQDSGQGAEVLKIINSFGAASLASIDPASYPAVAQAIRNAGGAV